MPEIPEIGSSLQKEEVYKETLKQLKSLLMEDDNLLASLANTAALLKMNIHSASWVGFYLAEDRELVLGPFQGKPACVRIEFGKGVCGKAAALKQTFLVEDVSKFPDHIACDPLSKSEIVVPILVDGRVVGVLDADSESLASFDELDKKYLENVVALLEGKFRTSTSRFMLR